MGIQIIIKTVIVYFFILLIMKFMGKREIGQLSLFDFVILLLIADASVMGIDNSDIPLYYFLFAILILAIIQKLLAMLLLKFAQLRDFFDGKESLIIIDGKVNIKEMKKQNYNFDDLIVQLRLKNVRSLSEVRYLILEANGEISVFKYNEFEKATSSSIGKSSEMKSGTNSLIKTEQEVKNIYPFPLIISGKIKYDNLKILDLNESWLKNKIKEKGYKDYKEIYYANYENNDLFILEVYKF